MTRERKKFTKMNGILFSYKLRKHQGRATPKTEEEV